MNLLKIQLPENSSLSTFWILCSGHSSLKTTNVIRQVYRNDEHDTYPNLQHYKPTYLQMVNETGPTWYQSLLQREHEANAKLVRLCEKQQEVIKHLEGVVEDLKANNASNANDVPNPLGARESSSSSRGASSTGTDDGPVTLGPRSPRRLRWTGTNTDLIPVQISGNNYHALVITPGMIREWNIALDISRRMRKYLKEKKFARERAHWAADLTRTEVVRDTPEGEMLGVHLMSDVKATYEFNSDRLDAMEDKLLDCDERIAKSREHLEHKIRIIFKRHGLLQPLDDGWKEELRNTRDAFSREMADLRESTSIETPDCDSMGDDF